MYKLSLCIGTFQFLTLKMAQRKSLCSSCSPRSRASCLEIHQPVSKQSQDLTLAVRCSGLWAGQSSLGWEFSRATRPTGLIGWKPKLRALPVGLSSPSKGETKTNPNTQPQEGNTAPLWPEYEEVGMSTISHFFGDGSSEGCDKTRCLWDMKELALLESWKAVFGGVVGTIDSPCPFHWVI